MVEANAMLTRRKQEDADQKIIQEQRAAALKERRAASAQVKKSFFTTYTSKDAAIEGEVQDEDNPPPIPEGPLPDDKDDQLNAASTKPAAAVDKTQFAAEAKKQAAIKKTQATMFGMTENAQGIMETKSEKSARERKEMIAASKKPSGMGEDIAAKTSIFEPTASAVAGEPEKKKYAKKGSAAARIAEEQAAAEKTALEYAKQEDEARKAKAEKAAENKAKWAKSSKASALKSAATPLVAAREADVSIAHSEKKSAVQKAAEVIADAEKARDEEERREKAAAAAAKPLVSAEEEERALAALVEDNKQRKEEFKARVTAFEAPEKKSTKVESDKGKAADVQAVFAARDKEAKASAAEKAERKQKEIEKKQELAAANKAKWAAAKSSKAPPPATTTAKSKVPAAAPASALLGRADDVSVINKPPAQLSAAEDDASPYAPGQLSKAAQRAQDDFANMKGRPDFKALQKKMSGKDLPGMGTRPGNRKDPIIIPGYKPGSVRDRVAQFGKELPAALGGSGPDKDDHNSKKTALVAAALDLAARSSNGTNARKDLMPEFPFIPERFDAKSADWSKFTKLITEYPETQAPELVKSFDRAKENATIMSANATFVARSMEPLVKAEYEYHDKGSGDEDPWRKTYEVKVTKSGPLYMPRKNKLGKTVRVNGNIAYDVLYHKKQGGKFVLDLDKSFIAPDDVPEGSYSSVTKDIREECWKNHEQKFEQGLGLNKPKSASKDAIMDHSPAGLAHDASLAAAVKHVIPPAPAADLVGGLSPAETKAAAAATAKSIPPPPMRPEPSGADKAAVAADLDKGMEEFKPGKRLKTSGTLEEQLAARKSKLEGKT